VGSRFAFSYATRFTAWEVSTDTNAGGFTFCPFVFSNRGPLISHTDRFVRNPFRIWGEKLLRDRKLNLRYLAYYHIQSDVAAAGFIKVTGNPIHFFGYERLELFVISRNLIAWVLQLQ
jgi:hypothetical protein